MIYFCGNWSEEVNWQTAYIQLSARWEQLSQQMSRAVQLQKELKNKIEVLRKENSELKTQKEQSKFPLPTKEDLSIHDSFQMTPKEITIKPEKKQVNRIKKQSSGETETRIEGHLYPCTYSECQRVYSSPVSLNLHIKMKHNGGTKKERQAYARILLEAEDRGQQGPKMNINLPPNFLEEYRTSYEYSKKYSM